LPSKCEALSLNLNIAEKKKKERKIEIFWDRVLLYSPNWPWTCNPPVFAVQELGLQACISIPSGIFFLNLIMV
jgi:hypothetical protein